MGIAWGVRFAPRSKSRNNRTSTIPKHVAGLLTCSEAANREKAFRDETQVCARTPNAQAPTLFSNYLMPEGAADKL